MSINIPEAVQDQFYADTGYDWEDPQGAELREVFMAGRASAFPASGGAVLDVDALAQEIRRVHGAHKLGAGALAEALLPFLARFGAPTLPDADRLDRELTQALTERDEYHDMADKLADAIATYLGVDIGEHSSDNNPWAGALDALAAAPSHAPLPEAQVGELAKFDIDALVAIPRNLIAAACSAIDKKRDAPGLLRMLRRYTLGDLSSSSQVEALSASQAHGKSEAVAYPPLPEPAWAARQPVRATAIVLTEDAFTAGDMRAYADAVRAQRPVALAAESAAPAVHVKAWLYAIGTDRWASTTSEADARNAAFEGRVIPLVAAPPHPAPAPAGAVGAVLVTHRTDFELEATATVSEPAEHSIRAEREDEHSNWYITVTGPNGAHSYDGWWRESVGRSAEDVVQEALRGSALGVAPLLAAAPAQPDANSGVEFAGWQERHRFHDGKWSRWAEVAPQDVEYFRRPARDNPHYNQIRQVFAASGTEADARAALQAEKGGSDA